MNFLNGEWQEGQAELHPIFAPFDQRPLMNIRYASLDQVQLAADAAAMADILFRNSSRWTRSKLLNAMSQILSLRREEMRQSIIDQAGKPRVLADAEIDRAVRCLKMAAEEAARFGGEWLPMDIDPIGQGFNPTQIEYFSRGPVLAITPFNFPLNLIIHKLAPALAVGAPIIVKPAPQTPGPANILAEIFQQARDADPELMRAIPAAAVQIIHTHHQNLDILLSDLRITTLSFTGSDQVGWQLQARASHKRVCLELGGDAAVIVCKDADLDRAAQRCAFGAFAYAGQICISVQRIYVARDIDQSFLQKLCKETEALVCGDPHDPRVVVGPLINAAAVQRVGAWLKEAQDLGAKILHGGKFAGAVLSPTILTDLNRDAALACNEAFAPIVVVESFDSLDDAAARVNASRFGLQAGVFTDSSANIDRLFKALQLGALVVNEVPTYRADHLPYGGIKASGLGREGIRYAMFEYSEPKALVRFKTH